jgi:hypothetical protein
MAGDWRGDVEDDWAVTAMVTVTEPRAALPSDLLRGVGGHWQLWLRIKLWNLRMND